MREFACACCRLAGERAQFSRGEQMTKMAFASIKRGVQQAIRQRQGRRVSGLRVDVGSNNIFSDLGFDKVEAENLKMRSDLMIRIVQFYRRTGMTQAAAAKALGLTQPRLNTLLKGKIGQFSLDALVNIASRAGLHVRLVVKKAA